MSKPFARRAFRSISITLQLPLSADDTGYTFRLRRFTVLLWTIRTPGTRMWLPGEVIEVSIIIIARIWRHDGS